MKVLVALAELLGIVAGGVIFVIVLSACLPS